MAGTILTGFRAFPGVADNPSQRVIEHLAARPPASPPDLLFHLLDVDYRQVGARIETLLDHAPKALLLTGYSNLATAITLERRATCLCAPDKPDVTGHVPDALPGEAALETALDLGRLRQCVIDLGIAAEISHDAGQYLCNYSYHFAMREAARRQLETQVLFVHLPALTASDLADSAASSMELETMARALSALATVLAE